LAIPEDRSDATSALSPIGDREPIAKDQTEFENAEEKENE
jgi:hypothetical protein